LKRKLFITGGLLVVIFIVAVVFIFSYDNINDDTSNQNNDSNEVINNNITNEQNIGGIVFTNITCEYDGSASILRYTIVNKTNEVVNLGEYELIIKNEDGDVIANVVGYLDQDISPNSEVNNGHSVGINLNNADSIVILLD